MMNKMTMIPPRTTKCKRMLCGGLLLVMLVTLCGCSLFYRDRIPKDGVWYCRELEATLDFTGPTRTGTIDVDGVRYDCQISVERFTNDIDFYVPSCEYLFSGECVAVKGDELYVVSYAEPRAEYVFVREEGIH